MCGLSVTFTKHTYNPGLISRINAPIVKINPQQLIEVGQLHIYFGGGGGGGANITGPLSQALLARYFMFAINIRALIVTHLPLWHPHATGPLLLEAFRWPTSYSPRHFSRSVLTWSSRPSCVHSWANLLAHPYWGTWNKRIYFSSHTYQHGGDSRMNRLVLVWRSTT